MAKTLLLMRHAKSDWSVAGRSDWERPLNKRGERDAPRMGRLIEEEGLVPDHVLCSDAKRAFRTAELAAEAFHFEEELDATHALYLADSPDFLSVLRELDSSIKTVLLVAHNPGTEYFIEALTGAAVDVPTATLAHIKLHCDTWSALTATGDYELVQIWRPKEL